jgi:hypothetical protein
MKTAPQSAEMMRFNESLRQVMQVTKPELNALLKDEKAIAEVRQKRGPRPKTSVSAPASSRKD